MYENVTRALLEAQRNEITESVIYEKLAARTKDKENRRILEGIAREEQAHYLRLRELTGEDVEPRRFAVLVYVIVGKVLGLTFSLKLMEAAEDRAQNSYRDMLHALPELEEIAREEEEHEQRLLSMIDEERVRYVGSVVLGLNDALVELTGALAGLTFAFQRTELVAVAGFVTGIAASLSMAASEYLSQRSEEDSRQSPTKAALYTGVAYILTVLFLISPYLVFSNPYVCLFCALTNAAMVIFLFTFYISVAKDYSFKHRFLEMLGLSFGVAAITFIIGIVIRLWLGFEV